MAKQTDYKFKFEIPRIGLFVNMDSIFKGNKLEKSYMKVDYKKIFEMVKTFPNRTGNAEVTKAFAYYIQFINEDGDPLYEIDQGFLDSMQINGYSVKLIKCVRYKKLESKMRFVDGVNCNMIVDPVSPFACMLAIDMLNAMDDVDFYVVCTNDGNFEPLFLHLQRMGKFVEVYGHSRCMQYSVRRGANRVQFMKEDVMMKGR